MYISHSIIKLFRCKTVIYLYSQNDPRQVQLIDALVLFVAGDLMPLTALINAIFVNNWNQDSMPKIVSEYDQEIPQSQTADNPVAP